MLDVLLCLCCLAALCLFFASLRGISSAAAALLALCCAILWHAAFGLAGLLRPGGWLFYILSFGLGAAAFWRRGRAKLLKKLLAPGALLFFGAAVVLAVWLALRQPLFTGWDEFSSWGPAVKITKLSNVLYPIADNGFWWTMTEYPALVMLSYFAQFFGVYAPWKVFWAYGLLYLACISAMLAPFSRRQWRIAIPLAACGLLVPFFFSQPYHTTELATTWLSIYGDLPGGMLLGGSLCLYFGVRQARDGALWPMLPVLGALAMVKENLLPIALVAAGVCAADLLIFGARPRGLAPLPGGDPPAKKRRLPADLGARLLWAAGGFAAVLAPFFGWNAYAKWANTQNTFMNGAQTNALISTGEGLATAARQLLRQEEKGEAFWDTARQMTDSFLGRVAVEGGYEYGTLKVSMAGTGLFTLLFILAVFAVAVLLAKGRRGRVALAGGLLLGGYAAYHLFLFIAYAYLNHRRGVLDYVRYTSSYTAGWLMLGLMLLALAAKWAGPRKGLPGRTAVLALALFMLGRSAVLLRPGYSVLDMTETTFAAQRAREDRAARFAQHLQPGHRLFFVHQGGDGSQYNQWHYDLYPNVVMYSITGGSTLELPPPDAPEVNNYATLERLQNYLADEHCSFILIDALDESFIKNYGSLFLDLDPAAAPALYRLNADGLYARVEVQP